VPTNPAPDPVRAGIYSALREDAELGELLSAPTEIHHRKAASGSTPPYVVFNLQAGTEIWTFGKGAEQALWLIKGICRGLKADAAESIDRRAQATLHKRRLEIEGGRLSILRESAVDYSEVESGETWHHVGSIYRIFHT
jgi:hypothetical protein